MDGSLSNDMRLINLLLLLLMGCIADNILNGMSLRLLFDMCCKLFLLLISAEILFIHIFSNNHEEYKNLFCIIKFLISMFRQRIFNL